MAASEDGRIEAGVLFTSEALNAVAGQTAAPVLVSVEVTAGTNINQTNLDPIPTSGPVSFTGAPSAVDLRVHVHYGIANSISGSRVAPVVELWRVSGTPTLLASAATGYIRDSNDHEESSFTISIWDVAAGTNPVYELRARRDSTVGAVASVLAPSWFQARAEF